MCGDLAFRDGLDLKYPRALQGQWVLELMFLFLC